MEIRIIRFDKTPSTNTECLSHAKQGAAEGLCVIADEQTEGRGRYGRNWASPRGSGLYFSLLLRPSFSSEYFPLITLAAAVAVRSALDSTSGIRADIKWPNDVLVGGRKICGILAEATETAGGMAIVLGIGVNIKSEGVPADLRDRATSLQDEAAAMPDADSLLRAIQIRFESLYAGMESAGGRTKVLESWCTGSSYCRGRNVRVTLGRSEIEGTTAGVDARGRLILKTDNGEVKVEAGEVTRLRS